jgi:hypothetical protein
MPVLLPILFNWLLNRAKEPSTWAGTAAVIAGASGVVPTDLQTSIQSIALGLCGIVAVVLREKGNA